MTPGQGCGPQCPLCSKPVMEPLERIIRPIVDGQIMSFLHDHPVVAEACDWAWKQSKAETLKNSLGKRITGDLLCPQTRMRLVAAVLELSRGAAGESEEVERCNALRGGEVEQPMPHPYAAFVAESLRLNEIARQRRLEWVRVAGIVQGKGRG